MSLYEIHEGVVKAGDDWHVVKAGRHTHTKNSSESALEELYNGVYHQLRHENESFANQIKVQALTIARLRAMLDEEKK